MTSKARHLADLIAVGARGKALGNTDVSIKSDKVSNYVDVYYCCANFHGREYPSCRFLPLDSVEISLES